MTTVEQKLWIHQTLRADWPDSLYIPHPLQSLPELSALISSIKERISCSCPLPPSFPPRLPPDQSDICTEYAASAGSHWLCPRQNQHNNQARPARVPNGPSSILIGQAVGTKEDVLFYPWSAHVYMAIVLLRATFDIRHPNLSQVLHLHHVITPSPHF